jgi:hypothetical protein
MHLVVSSETDQDFIDGNRGKQVNRKTAKRKITSVVITAVKSVPSTDTGDDGYSSIKK